MSKTTEEIAAELLIAALDKIGLQDVRPELRVREVAKLYAIMLDALLHPGPVPEWVRRSPG